TIKELILGWGHRPSVWRYLRRGRFETEPDSTTTPDRLGRNIPPAIIHIFGHVLDIVAMLGLVVFVGAGHARAHVPHDLATVGGPGPATEQSPAVCGR